MASPYHLCWADLQSAEHCTHDSHGFVPRLNEHELNLFGKYKHSHLYRVLGPHVHAEEGISDILFTTARLDSERISVIGTWELFI